MISRRGFTKASKQCLNRTKIEIDEVVLDIDGESNLNITSEILEKFVFPVISSDSYHVNLRNFNRVLE